eukprot:CAMPEP_0204275690 /NCGR_PEP_ID=MMETSP0468-20130131/26494_1 /ASSEMBLY_ACC=CAM_ASM_000383 /TAXON_ID=2969 /ORGANISM="Oxyrrhis marina" /LENGTH=50 /DNA_ID=CAMNT_0051252095 /DNA_START=70 /DNA_END=222 /DNA_ORIENTATION=-
MSASRSCALLARNSDVGSTSRAPSPAFKRLCAPTSGAEFSDPAEHAATKS